MAASSTPPGATAYPLPLAWSYLLVVGYITRAVFASLRLPGAIGVFIVGYGFSHFMQEDIYSSRDDLVTFAFFLVLLNAGFEVQVKSMRAPVLVMALLPGLLEVTGIALYAKWQLGFSAVQSLVLGSVLFPLGEGLVIPKLQEFKQTFPGHPLVRLVLNFAPLEATLALALFGFLSGVSHKRGEADEPAGLLVADVVVRVVATITVGALAGSAAGWALSNITRPEVKGRQVFAGTPVEGFLLVMGMGLGAFGAAEIIPVGFCPGRPLFNKDLLVIVIGSSFAHSAEQDVIHGIESYVASIWVFGSIILFSMLGSKTSIEVLGHFWQALPLMAGALCCRFVGCCVASYASQRLQGRRKVCFADTMFCFLCTLPRATLQGALGASVKQEAFFQTDGLHGESVRNMIAAIARLWIFCFAIGGSLLLEFAGPRLLRISAAHAAAEEDSAPAAVALEVSAEAVGAAATPESKGHHQQVAVAEENVKRPAAIDKPAQLVHIHHQPRDIEEGRKEAVPAANGVQGTSTSSSEGDEDVYSTEADWPWFCSGLPVTHTWAERGGGAGAVPAAGGGPPRASRPLSPAALMLPDEAVRFVYRSETQ